MSKSKVSESIKVPVQADPEVFVQGFVDSGDIRIRFVSDGFLHEGAFRHFLNQGKDGEVFERGPVTVTTHVRGDDVSMDVVIVLRDGITVTKTLGVSACNEIEMRIDAVRAMLHTYDPSEPAEDADTGVSKGAAA